MTEHSHALDLESDVFKRDPKAMARSLKRSAERSVRRKSSPFRSAMSMLTLYENRAGASLSASRRTTRDDRVRRDLLGWIAPRSRCRGSSSTTCQRMSP